MTVSATDNCENPCNLIEPSNGSNVTTSSVTVFNGKDCSDVRLDDADNPELLLSLFIDFRNALGVVGDAPKGEKGPPSKKLAGESERSD